jgi:peptide/nickel transport system substrate-binding protein
MYPVGTNVTSAVSRLILLVLAVVLLGFGLAQEPRQGGTLVMATQADAATLDPHNTGDVPSQIIEIHIYDTLVRWDEEGRVAPSLAEEWTWSDDGLTLTMRLKEGVSFHDGTMLTSEVVKHNFDWILDPENNVRARPQYTSIERVEAPDELTVVFHLGAPDGSLMAGLAAPIASIISQQAMETHGRDIALNPVGTGPFRFVQWDTNEQVVVEAFEDHHGGRPYLDRIIFRPVPDQQARVAMLEAGDAHVAAPIPLQDVSRLEADDRFVIASIVGMDNLHMPLNFFKEPLQDVRVRQALNYAIDNEAIARSIYLGYARPLTDSPLAPAVFGYSPVGEYYAYDLERARALMAEAGYADAFDMLIWIPDGRYIQDRRVGEAVAGYLSELGINVELQTFEWATYVNMILGGSADDPPAYDAVMISFAVGTRDADRGLGPIFRCDQWVPNGFGLSFYCNPQVDEWHTRGRRATDPDERLEAYAEMSKLIMEDAPAIFLVAYEFVAAHSSQVNGVELDPNGGALVMNAWLDE